MKYLLAALLLLSVPSLAQSNPKAPATSVASAKPKGPTAAVTITKAELDSLLNTRMNETDYYKKLYDQSVESERKFVELSDHSITYSLAFVFGIISLLAIAQILYSFVISKRQVAELRNEVDAEVSRKLEQQNINTANATAQRILDSEMAFRAAINRELDEYKASSQKLLADNQKGVEIQLRRLTDIANTSSKLSISKDLLARKIYELALTVFIVDVAQVRINELSIDSETAYSIQSYTDNVKEIETHIYEIIVKIRAILDAANHPANFLWAVVADKWPVYKNIQNTDGTPGREYIRNTPTK